MPIRTTRNPVARAAILRKGGVHEKCRTAKRQQQKRQLDDAVDEYMLSRYSHPTRSSGDNEISRARKIKGSPPRPTVTTYRHSDPEKQDVREEAANKGGLFLAILF